MGKVRKLRLKKRKHFKNLICLTIVSVLVISPTLITKAVLQIGNMSHRFTQYVSSTSWTTLDKTYSVELIDVVDVPGGYDPDNFTFPITFISGIYSTSETISSGNGAAYNSNLSLRVSNNGALETKSLGSTYTNTHTLNGVQQTQIKNIAQYIIGFPSDIIYSLDSVKGLYGTTTINVDCSITEFNLTVYEAVEGGGSSTGDLDLTEVVNGLNQLITLVTAQNGNLSIITDNTNTIITLLQTLNSYGYSLDQSVSSIYTYLQQQLPYLSNIDTKLQLNNELLAQIIVILQTQVPQNSINTNMNSATTGYDYVDEVESTFNENFTVYMDSLSYNTGYFTNSNDVAGIFAPLAFYVDLVDDVYGTLPAKMQWLITTLLTLAISTIIIGTVGMLAKGIRKGS